MKLFNHVLVYYNFKYFNYTYIALFYKNSLEILWPRLDLFLIFRSLKLKENSDIIYLHFSWAFSPRRIEPSSKLELEASESLCTGLGGPPFVKPSGDTPKPGNAVDGEVPSSSSTGMLRGQTGRSSGACWCRLRLP